MAKVNRNTLVCTVGTSIFAAFRQDALPPDAEKYAKIWRTAKAAFENGRWPAMADALLRLPPSNRMCGAEINSIEELISGNIMEVEQLFFLVSDTNDGRNVGTILRRYFQGRKDLTLRGVECVEVEGLQDAQPKMFKTKGLRNLVREIGKIIQRMGGPGHVAIDATGGYKAQIAVAVIMGQVFNIPVFYKHERFSEIISFPPLPISFDYELIARYSDIFDRLERGDAITSLEIGELDDRIKIFVDEVETLGEYVWELNALGLIYLLGFQVEGHKRPELQQDAGGRKEPTFGNDHHFPNGFKEFVEKLWRENRWISTIYTIPYHGQKAIRMTGFRVERHDKEDWLVGCYVKGDFGAKFRIVLPEDSSSLDVLSWAASLLNKQYGNG